MVTDSDEPEVTITDALDLYVRLKGTGRGKVFARTAERNANYLTECVGETSYTIDDGHATVTDRPGWGVEIHPDWLAAAQYHKTAIADLQN